MITIKTDAKFSKELSPKREEYLITYSFIQDDVELLKKEFNKVCKTIVEAKTIAIAEAIKHFRELVRPNLQTDVKIESTLPYIIKQLNRIEHLANNNWITRPKGRAVRKILYSNLYLDIYEFSKQYNCVCALDSNLIKPISDNKPNPENSFFSIVKKLENISHRLSKNDQRIVNSIILQFSKNYKISDNQINLLNIIIERSTF